MSRRAIDASTSVGNAARRGIAWQLFGRGGEHAVRLVANLILTRLLLPADMGLMGMVALGLAFAEGLAFVGTDQAVMSAPRGGRPRFIATAWAVALIRAGLMATLLVLLAGPLSRAFDHPEAIGLFQLVALQPLLLALSHPGANVRFRDLQFRAWTLGRLACVVLGVSVTIALAVHLRSALALVVGQLVTSAFLAIAAFVVTPTRLRVRPRVDRAHLRTIFRLGLGAAGTPLLIMGVMQVPVLLIGPMLGPAALGIYLVHRRLCESGPQVAAQAAHSVILPLSARFASDRHRLRTAWMNTLRRGGLVALGASAVLAWLGADFIGLLVGDVYRGPALQFSLLALAGGLNAVLGLAVAFFWGVQRPQDERITQLVRLIVLIGVGIPLLQAMGPTGLAAATVVSSAAGCGSAALLMQRTAGIRMTHSLAALTPGIGLASAILLAGWTLDGSVSLGAVGRTSVAIMACGLGLLGIAMWLRWRAAPRHSTHPSTTPSLATGTVS